MIENILPVSSAARVVVTESSTYLFDSGTVVRLAGCGAAHPDGEWPDAASLRRDGEPIPVLGASDPVVGEPMMLLLQVREDGVQTLRRTTAVREIR